LSASLTSLAWNPAVLSVGASGAIFGIAGALIASFYLGEFSLPRAAISGTLRSVAVFVGYNLVFGAVIARTDNAAHVGGLVMGLILGALIAKVAPLQEQILIRVGVLLFGLMLVGGGIAWLQHSRGYIGAMNQAYQSLDDGKATDAIAKLNALVRQRPDYWPAHLQLGRAYTIQRDYAKAGVEFKRVIQLNPGNEDAYDYLGYTELEQQHSDQARAAFAQLLKMNPISADAHAGLAAVFSLESKYSEALEEYKRTLQLAPDYQNVFYDMGLAQSKLELYDDAIQSFLKQRDKGDDPDNESALASVYEAKGMHREAEEASQRAQQFQKQH